MDIFLLRFAFFSLSPFPFSCLFILFFSVSPSKFELFDVFFGFKFRRGEGFVLFLFVAIFFKNCDLASSWLVS